MLRSVPIDRPQTHRLRMMTMPRDPAKVASSRTGSFEPAASATPAAILLAGLAILTWPAIASPPVQTFGPGKVSCQRLAGTQMDCLLAADRITQSSGNVATFSLDLLPPGQRTLLRKWCLAASDECTVTVTGRRASLQSTRLSAVTSVHWTRPNAPMDEAAAQAFAKAPSADMTGLGIRPVP